jgi:hypothetical protein
MTRTLTLPPRDQIADDTPLRLYVAAALEYPDGSIGSGAHAPPRPAVGGDEPELGTTHG